MVLRTCRPYLLLLTACAAACACAASEARPATPKVDLDALLAQLRSDDSDARDAAANVLREHAVDLWEKLVPLASGNEPEVRARVRDAMARAAVARIPEWVKDAEKAVADHDQYKRDFQKAVQDFSRSDLVKSLEGGLAELAAAEAGAHEAQRAEIARRKEKLEADLARARQASEQAHQAEYQDLRNAYVKKEEAERGETLRLRTRLLQLYQLRADRTVTLAYRADMNRAFDPRLLPFEKRLNLTVCYECLGETFAQAMARIGTWAGIEIAIAPEVNEEKRVRALADQRSTEQDVRSLVTGLAAVQDLECRVDAEAQRITIVPRGK